MNRVSSRATQMLGIVISLLILSLLMINTKMASSDSANPGVYSPDSKPFGLSYSEWTVKWWQWYLKIPDNQHPFGDRIGAKCGLMQNGSVWFLVGSAGKVERNCSIPSDKAILIPIINTECSYAETPALKNKEELTKCAIDGQKDAVITATVDNHPIIDPMNYRKTTDIFNVTIAFPPIFPLNPPSTQEVNSQAVSDGWYLFLEPMSKGQHDVNIKASIIPPAATITEQPTSSTDAAAIDATYHLTIK